MTDQDLPQEERELMRDILKSAAGIYANMGIEDALTYKFFNNDIPILCPSERIRIVLIREHDDLMPSWEPMMEKQAEYFSDTDKFTVTPIMKPLPLKEYEAEVKEVLIPA